MTEKLRKVEFKKYLNEIDYSNVKIINGYFHEWGLMSSYNPNDGTAINISCGIVEDELGNVHLVNAGLIKFL